MFTGIVEELGVVEALDDLGDAVRLTVRGPLVVEDAGLGDSIAVNGCCLTVAAKDDRTFTADVMRETLDKVKDRMQSGVAVLASVDDGKVSLIAGVTKDLTGKVKAGDLVNHVARQVGGKGGGRPDMAQAGGTNPAALPEALRSIEPWLEQRL